MDMNIQNLISEIEEAFQSVGYPGDDNIIPLTDTYQERYDMWLEFKGRWQDVSPQTVEDYRLCYSYFSPEGLHYYLPCLLISAIDPIPYEIDSYLIFAFVPPDDISKKEVFDKKINLLSHQQKVVINKFIEHFFNENPEMFSEFRSKTIEYWNNLLREK